MILRGRDDILESVLVIHRQLSTSRIMQLMGNIVALMGVGLLGLKVQWPKLYKNVKDAKGMYMDG